MSFLGGMIVGAMLMVLGMAVAVTIAVLRFAATGRSR
jgi:hypothetical protein